MNKPSSLQEATMAHESLSQNPFMLMMHPDVVLAAVERSERLSQLNRHLCRPLDRQMPTADRDGGGAAADAGDDEEAPEQLDDPLV
jgi:hypothetical protein